MKTILTLLFAVLAFTAVPTTPAKADLLSAGTTAVTQAAVGHRDYGYRHGGYYRHRDYGYRHNYYRGYRHHHYRGYRHSGPGIYFRF